MCFGIYLVIPELCPIFLLKLIYFLIIAFPSLIERAVWLSVTIAQGFTKCIEVCNALEASNKFDDYRPSGDGVMNSALACCAGGPGSIPTVGKRKKSCNIQMCFSRHKVVG